MKLLKVLVAALVLVGMVVPAIAEDRLQLSGEMRVRGWHTDVDGNDFTRTWADQRLRIGGKIAVAEGVSITFRTDVTERGWGAGGSDFGSGRMPQDGQQWDRAHMDLAKGNFHLRAGQQYVGYGKTFAVDTQEAGLSMNLVGAVPFNAFALLDNDNAAASDAFLFGLAVSPKGDNWSSQLFAAGQSKRANADEQVYVIGATGSFDLGAVKLVSELDFFTGDRSSTVDAFGTQLLVDASMAASDALRVGGQLFYALGDEDDRQYTFLGNGFNGYDPIMDVGTSLSNEAITFGRPFDFSGSNAGVIGGRLYANMKASDALKFGASLAYLETEENKAADVEVMALAAGMVYTILPNTSFQLQLQYVDGEDNDSNEDVEVFSAGTGLYVSF